MPTEPEDLPIEDIDDENDIAVAVSYDIATYPSDFTLAGIAKMWEDDDIQIPDFQREFVWTIRQSSLLVDSFLSGLPVPPVFFYIDEGSKKNLVIDGQQRILSVIFFMEGYFGRESTQGRRQIFRLQGLDEKSPYSKKRFVCGFRGKAGTIPGSMRSAFRNESGHDSRMNPVTDSDFKPVTLGQWSEP